MRIKFWLEKRENVSSWLVFGIPIFSVLFAFLFVGVIMEFLGYGAIRAYMHMLNGAFGSLYNLSESVLQSIPLLFASLGVAVALSSSIMNIGAEGQYIMGAWAATGIAVFCPWIPDSLALPAMLTAGFIVGAIWGIIAVLPRVKWGASETITTLMFNYIALQWVDFWIYGSWRDVGSINLPISPVVPPHAMLTTFFGTRVHSGLFMGIVVAILLYLFLRKTTTGYQIRVIGKNEKAAKYAGINISRSILMVMLLSGGLAGVAGVMQIGGAGRRLISNVAGGTGYTAVIIARLSKNNPLVIIFISFLFGGLLQGGYSLQIAQIPWQMSQLLQGTILLFALGGELLVTHKPAVRFIKRVDKISREKDGIEC